MLVKPVVHFLLRVAAVLTKLSLCVRPQPLNLGALPSQLVLQLLNQLALHLAPLHLLRVNCLRNLISIVLQVVQNLAL